MADRNLTVRLKTVADQYKAGMAQAGQSTEKLAVTADKTFGKVKAAADKAGTQVADGLENGVRAVDLDGAATDAVRSVDLQDDGRRAGTGFGDAIVDGADTGLADLDGQVEEALRKAVAEFERRQSAFKIKPDVDQSGVREGLRRLQVETSNGIRKIEVPVDLKGSDLTSEVRALVKDAESRAGSIDVPVDMSSAKADAARIGDEAGAGFSGAFGQAAGDLADVVDVGALGALVNPATAAGALLGVGFTTGFSHELDLQAAAAKAVASTGTGNARATQEVVGQIFSDNYGADVAQIGDAVAIVTRNIDALGISGQEDLTAVAKKALNVSSIFDQDLGRTVNAASQLIRTGLAGNATEAFDLITVGLQSSANKSDDLLDTFNEYSTQFRQLGLDGPQALGLISQAVQGGARDSDVAADALKEFAIRAQDGSKTTADGFEAIGLNAETMAARVAAGGPTAAKALDLVFDRIRAIEDPAKRSRVAVALFGTQAEDLQGAFSQFDLSTATDQLGKVEGAADKAGDAIAGSLPAKVEQGKRQITASLADIPNRLLTLFSGDAGLGDVGALLGSGLDTAFGGYADAATNALSNVKGLLGLGDDFDPKPLTDSLGSVTAAVDVLATGADIAAGPVAGLGDAAGGATPQVDEFGNEVAASGDQAQQSEEQFQSYLDTLRGATDPLFAMVSALRSNYDAQADLKQAQEDMNAAIAEFGYGSDEAVAAYARLDEAQMRSAQSAQGVMLAAEELQHGIENGSTSLEAAKTMLLNWASQGLISAETAAYLAGQFDLAAASAGGVSAKTGEAKTALDNINGAEANTTVTANTNPFWTGIVSVLGFKPSPVVVPVTYSITNLPVLGNLFGQNKGPTPIRRAGGGTVPDLGLGSGDTVPAWLSPREFVVNPQVTSQPGVLPFLTQLNAGTPIADLVHLGEDKSVQHFATGGLVRASASSPRPAIADGGVTSALTAINTIVNEGGQLFLPPPQYSKLLAGARDQGWKVEAFEDQSAYITMNDGRHLGAVSVDTPDRQVKYLAQVQRFGAAPAQSVTAPKVQPGRGVSTGPTSDDGINRTGKGPDYVPSIDWATAITAKDWGEEGVYARSVLQAYKRLTSGRPNGNIWEQAISNADWGLEGQVAKAVLRAWVGMGAPKFHDGGVVQGPPGTDVPAIVRPGETVRTVPQEQALQRELVGASAVPSGFVAPAGPLVSAQAVTGGGMSDARIVDRLGSLERSLQVAADRGDTFHVVAPSPQVAASTIARQRRARNHSRSGG